MNKPTAQDKRNATMIKNHGAEQVERLLKIEPNLYCDCSKCKQRRPRS